MSTARELYPTCLIVSSLQDEHVHAVLPHLSDRTLPLVLDLSKYAVDYTASLELDSQPRLRIDSACGQTFLFDKLESVWWRRPQPFSISRNETPAISTYVREEFDHFWSSAFSSLPSNVRWYNPIDSNRAADRKFFQLSLAKELGLQIPHTVITSNPHEARRFIEDADQAIYKSFRGNLGAWEPTRIADKELLSQINEITSCPIILQHYIRGGADYRLTVIDNEYEVVRFDVSKSRYEFDVRVDTKIPCERSVIPEDTLEKVFEFMSAVGIRYGAFDFRESQSGDLYFLEVNPAGQFLYLDIQAGTTLAARMASALSSTEEFSSTPLNPAANVNVPIEMHSSAPLALRTRHIEHMV